MKLFRESGGEDGRSGEDGDGEDCVIPVGEEQEKEESDELYFRRSYF